MVMNPTTGLPVTPRLIEVVRSMRDGGWFRVRRNLDGLWAGRAINSSVARRLVELGWAERQVYRSLSMHEHPRTDIRLNEAGLERAREFDAASESCP